MDLILNLLIICALIVAAALNISIYDLTASVVK